MSDLHDVRSAAQLVAFGLARMQAGDSLDYRELITRYVRDIDFQALTETVAEGLALRVVACTERAGMVLAAVGAVTDDDPTGPLGGHRSPFLPLSRDLQRIKIPTRARERQLWTLALLAVAYCAFPRPEDRDDDSRLGQVEPAAVEQVLRALCAELDKQVKRSVDPPHEEPQLERLWRAYLTTAETGTTGDERALMSSAVALITRVCETLTEIKCLRPMRRSDPLVYQTTPKFQVQVREMASASYWGELSVACERLTLTEVDV
jgi:hypothetical protein